MIKQSANFDQEVSIGEVTEVDTSRVYIKVTDHTSLQRLQVGHLLAIRGTIPEQFLIAIIERITRLPEADNSITYDTDDPSLPVPDYMRDTIRAVLVGTYWTKRGNAGALFKRGADACPQISQSCYSIEDTNLSSFMGVLSKDIDDELALEIGNFAISGTAKAIADGDKFFQRHAAIVGSTGSGKSWTVATILEAASKLAYSNLIVLDLHGEYAPLAKASGSYARGFRVAGPGDLSSPESDVVFLPYWMLNREEMLSLVLDRSDMNAPNQATKFTSTVRQLKRSTLLQNGKDDIESTFTIDSPIPYDIQEMLTELRAADVEMVQGKTQLKQGELYGKLTRFISRLEAKIEDRRYGFMFAPPAWTFDYDWLENMAQEFLLAATDKPGIKIVDFSEVPSDVLPVVVAVFARFLYDVQFWQAPESRTPFCLVCDEAHLYLPSRNDSDVTLKRALESFERIAKEGRKYGVSLLVVSQRPADVSRTILSQCNNFLALRLTNEQDQAAVTCLMPDSMTGISDILPLLDVGEALLIGDAILLPSRICLKKPSIHPRSSTRDFWREWREREPNSEAITAAVQNLRKQSRI